MSDDKTYILNLFQTNVDELRRLMIGDDQLKIDYENALSKIKVLLQENS